MVETKERASEEARAFDVSALAAARSSHLDAVVTPRLSLRRQIGHFVLHYFAMCLPMCIGFAVGDVVFFSAAGLFGYSHPFMQLPELSVIVVTFNMTAPMVAWMLFRGMPRRPTAEMAA